MIARQLEPNVPEVALQDADVRLAERHDVPVLVTLMTAFYGEAGYELPEQAATRAFVALFADPRLGRVWLVEKDQAPVGYLVLTLGFSMEFGGVRGFVDDLFVSPPARGNGLGAALLAEVQRACKELGVCALLVETGPEDHPARRLYARAGFQENGRVFLTQTFVEALHEADERKSIDPSIRTDDA